MAGIQALKKTSDIIPLAHGGVGVEGAVVRCEVVGGDPKGDGTTGDEKHAFNERDGNADVNTITDENAGDGTRLQEAMGLDKSIPPHGGVRIAVLVETTAKTGVEMEALTGVVGAGLTVVDMVKGVDRGVSIGGVKVVGKKGGRRGGWGVWGHGGMEGEWKGT